MPKEIVDIQEILELTKTLQSWRPEDVTRHLAFTMPEPFCGECADWHYEYDVHSTTDLEK